MMIDEESSAYFSAQGSANSQRQSLAIGGTCLEFEFPLRKEILCDEPSNKNIFYVTDKVDVSRFEEGRIRELIFDLEKQLAGSKSHCTNITSNDSFDVLFNLLNAY